MSQLVKKAAKVYILKNPISWVFIAVGLFFIGLMFIVALYLMSLSEAGNDDTGGLYDPSISGGTASVSPLVMRYEPLVRKYAKQYGVEQYVPLLLAKMQQESGGRLPDVMQSSESLGLPRNSIMNPEYSIQVGVQYFSGIIKQTKGDVQLALQSYNFGSGFINYALDRGGYSKEVAISFSNMMAAKMGWDRYGDINYVDNVLRYLNTNTASPVNAKGFVIPLSGGNVTSDFGTRFDPITGVPSVHAGVDFSCSKGQPIYSTKAGTIERAGWQDPGNTKAGYGQRVYVNHGGNQVTIYAHLSEIHVSPGQKVEQGQQIGGCGTTGKSTGNHLHFELVLTGNKVNPLDYIQ